jgi:hypothetical protein
MAILSKTGITNGTTIEASHITQSIDAFTGEKEYNIFLSGSFNMTGSINGEPGIINPLTSSYAINALSSSISISSSFATTASYALNAGGGGLSSTLTFFHTEVSGTINTQRTYIGGFACPPSNNSERIGISSPISGTIIKASIHSHSSSPAIGAAVKVSLSTDGGVSYPINLGTLDLQLYKDKNTINLNTPININNILNIRLTEENDSNAIWNVNVMLLVVEET